MSEETLASLDEKTEEPPESRFKDASAAREYFKVLERADEDASRDRAKQQLMFDGEPPYDSGELRRANQGYRCNVNFGEAEDLLEKALGAYIDMLQSVEVLFTADTAFGETPTERKENSRVVCDKVSKMIRKWGLFLQRYLLNATYFVSEAVSFATFRDHIDWRFDVRRLGQFYVPRDSDSSEDEVEVAFAREKFTVTELYNKIRGGGAEEMGWDEAAVKKAILSVSKNGDGSQYKSWEDWVTEAKSNDLCMSARAKVVEVLYCWVTEFDGTITQYILTTHDGISEFLFEKKAIYDRMGEAFVSFVFNVGSGGKFHGIRGLGKKIFSAVQTNNRMYGHHIDGAMLASSLLIRPKNASALGKAQLSFRGPFTVIHPEAEVVERGLGNFAQNTLPVINQMKALIREKAGGYTASLALPDDAREMSRFEASARISNATGMTVKNLLLFVEQFEKLIVEMVRRIAQEGWNEQMPGGKEIMALYAEMEEDGIPLEALHQLKIHTVKITRPVGAGSAVAREEAFRQLTEISPGFDETGRKALTRNRAAHILGSYEAADEYIERPDVIRKPDAAKIAYLETQWLLEGIPVPVQSNEMHITHLEEHTQVMAQIINQVSEGLPMEEVVEGLFVLHEHCVSHLNEEEGNVSSQFDVSRFRQILQQSGEIITNGFRKLEAQRQREAEEGGGQSTQVDPKEEAHREELRRKAELHMQNLQIIKQKADAEIQAKLLKANADAQLADAKAAREISPYDFRTTGAGEGGI